MVWFHSLRWFCIARWRKSHSDPAHDFGWCLHFVFYGEVDEDVIQWVWVLLCQITAGSWFLSKPLPSNNFSSFFSPRCRQNIGWKRFEIRFSYSMGFTWFQLKRKYMLYFLPAAILRSSNPFHFGWIIFWGLCTCRFRIWYGFQSHFTSESMTCWSFYIVRFQI